MPPLPELEAALDQWVPDADLLQTTDSSWDGLFVSAEESAWRHGKPFVALPLMHLGDASVRAHFQMVHQIDAYRRATAVLALSKREAAALAYLGVAQQQIHVIHTGVEPELPLPAEDLDPGTFRRQHHLTGPIVAFLGANTHDKGTFALAQAVGRLNLNMRPVDLVCAGTQSGKLAAFLRRQPQEVRSASQGHMHLLGVVDEGTKHQLLAACDLLALPSQVDTFGQVLLEAWLHGKPVIGAAAGGIPEVIEEGRTGLLVPFDDADALAQAISWLLDHPEEAERMGQRGREQTLSRWSWGAVYDRVWPIYERCLDA
jgi:glycosyltransferase involved in cell wall biosynthesis